MTPKQFGCPYLWKLTIRGRSREGAILQMPLPPQPSLGSWQCLPGAPVPFSSRDQGVSSATATHPLLSPVECSREGEERGRVNSISIHPLHSRATWKQVLQPDRSPISWWTQSSLLTWSSRRNLHWPGGELRAHCACAAQTKWQGCNSFVPFLHPLLPTAIVIFPKNLKAKPVQLWYQCNAYWVYVVLPWRT